jgi:hypothetical protein
MPSGIFSGLVSCAFAARNKTTRKSDLLQSSYVENSHRHLEIARLLEFRKLLTVRFEPLQAFGDPR